MIDRELKIIGVNEYVSLAGCNGVVPAKIDTGADSSAVWASDIFIDKQSRLHFCLFDKNHPLYTGKESVYDEYTVSAVKSSNGSIEIRYKVKIVTVVNGKRIGVMYNLSNRANNQYPVLIGRKTLSGKFLVNVSLKRVDPADLNDVPRPIIDLRKEFNKNPYQFYRKYHGKDS